MDKVYEVSARQNAPVEIRSSENAFSLTIASEEQRRYKDQSKLAAGQQRAARYQTFKRLVDVSVSAIALVLLSPFFFLLACAIKVVRRDVPVFFGVTVVGRGGHSFKMWKFSTMVRDGHLRLHEILEADPALKKEWDENAKLQRDPRILPVVGHLLRKTSLNELPQLWNVLVGDMSLVAPRPITAAEEFNYIKFGSEAVLKARHGQRPGITGLWQATGRSNVTYQQRVQLDIEYLEEQSFWFDIKILWWTVGKVFSGDGAI